MLTIPNLHNWRHDLSDEIKQALNKRLTYKTFDRGEIIYSSGDIASVSYQVETGKVKIGNYNKEGREIIIGVAMDGDCFGEVGMIAGLRRCNYAQACTNIKVNLLQSSHFIELAMKYPELSLQLNKFMATRMQFMFSNYETALLLPLYERLGNAIMRQCLSRGVKDENENLYLPDISQEMLGQMVGATRQSVGREMKKMENEKLLHIKYGKIYICDIKKMIQLFDLVVNHETILPIYPAELP